VREEGDRKRVSFASELSSF